MPIQDHHLKFKNNSKPEDSRRRRAEGSVELRKAKKDENLMKRRNVNDETYDTDDATSPHGDKKRDTFTILPLEQCVEIFRAGDTKSADYTLAVESIRRMLSRQHQPPVDEIIKSGAIPYLIEGLKSSSPKLQFESAWALTNIASGTSQQTKAVVEYGVVPWFVNLLNAGELYVADQCCWALGNIAGDSADMRDIVINAGAIPPLINCLNKNISEEFYRTLTWTLSNLCRNKNPPPSYEAVAQILPAVVHLLRHSDKLVQQDACWALSYVSDGTDDRIDLVLDHNVVPAIIELLKTAEPALIAPSLRCLGNIVTGNDQQTQIVVDSGAVQAMIPVVAKVNKNSVLKEAMWLVSNIAAGNRTQIQAIIDANAIPFVIDVMTKGDYKSQFESCWVINNITSGGTVDQIMYLCKCGIIDALCDCLKSKEPKMICLVLDAMCNILSAANNAGHLEPATLAVEECGGLDKIEQLQSHENEDVYVKALSVIEKYFNNDEENVDENKPVVACDNVQAEFFTPPEFPEEEYKF